MTRLSTLTPAFVRLVALAALVTPAAAAYERDDSSDSHDYRPAPTPSAPVDMPADLAPPTTSDMPVTSPADEGMCRNGFRGIESKGACCVFECGQCGGGGCSTVGESLGLGADDCCEVAINANATPCEEAGEAPCVIGGEEKVGECSGDPVKAHEQCGGGSWTGSTCCEDGYECVVMGAGTCYSECRPVDEGGAPAAPSPEPEDPERPEPTPMPATEQPVATEEPVSTEPPASTEEPTREPEEEGGFEYGPDTQFYRPGPGAIGAADAQIAELKAEGRPMDAAKVSDMIEQPMAYWLTGEKSVGETMSEVQEVMSAAGGLGEVPVFAAYNLPFRDCAQFSAGGATTMADYEEWIDGVAAGIGSGNAVVILEPDGLAIIPHATMLDGTADWCQPAEGNAATDEEERYAMTAYAVAALKANPGTKVYIDGSHADWHKPDEMAHRLLLADVQTTDGFFLNLSNYVKTDRQIGHGERVAKCVFWGLQGNDVAECTDTNAWYAENVDPIIAEMGDDDVPHFVIDTSRNGNGVWSSAKDYPDPQEWCNPPDRALGVPATTVTDSPYADAYLWCKIPGESDGECNRGLTDMGGVDPEWGFVLPNAGDWFPEQVLDLVGATGK